MAGDVNRRAILAAIGASTTVGVGSVAGNGDDIRATKSELTQARDLYNSQTKAIVALQEYAQPILDQLESAEVIPNASPEIFTPEGRPAAANTDLSIDGVKFPKDSAATARISAKLERDDISVSVYVKPGQEAAHGIVHHDPDDPHLVSIVKLAGADNDDVSTQGEICADSAGDSDLSIQDCGGGGGSCSYSGVHCTGSTSMDCYGVFDEYEVYTCDEGNCYYGDHEGCCGDPDYNCAT